MTAASTAAAPRPLIADHRIETAQKKRELMRRRIIDATTRVYAYRGAEAPVIEDVVRAAQVSRGTFYKHFNSLDEALVAASIEANDRMIRDILPLYGFLKEPWQRVSVGFRLFLLRAWKDPKWAAFITRMDAWPHESLIAAYMLEDFQRGVAAGQFHMTDPMVATDFVMGALAGLTQTLRCGGVDACTYIDNALLVMLQTFGCTPELRDQAEAFSRKHLHEWIQGERQAWVAW